MHADGVLPTDLAPAGPEPTGESPAAQSACPPQLVHAEPSFFPDAAGKHTMWPLAFGQQVWSAGQERGFDAQPPVVPPPPPLSSLLHATSAIAPTNPKIKSLFIPASRGRKLPPS